MSEEIKKFEFELVGPHAGKTCQLGPTRSKKYQFINGKHAVIGSASGLANLTRILAKNHNAHLPGSPEHTAAVAAWDAATANSKGQTHGHSNVQPTPATGQTHAVPGNVQSTGSGVTPNATNVKSTNNVTHVSPSTPKTTTKG